MEGNGIKAYVRIKNNQLIANGHLLFEKPNVSPRDFFNSAYEALEINYPRFFKMDSLCKTGFIAAEMLMRHAKNAQEYLPEETGLLFFTANSSLDTDMLYQASTVSAPSPSLFVYTLPNIVVGELCIRHGIKGESSCLIFDTFNPLFQSEYLNTLLDAGKIKTGVSGWADFCNDTFDALFYLVDKSNSETLMSHSAENLDKIYHHP